ncbi:hypothetical protein Ctob_007093 [Chrysochromulina tobinii]|uniref:Uncharacterized protein n=1 Tax=Chrysochromulina tobinii TaxID=1460289 RepID=A0A0M0JCP7_9EUKA|nr:hypothetical protein Ctob_007093 [Chrysochromulina tobinii]|eukprot:KOO24354.1 hypothetical protein Ctob_007093 [Chrysochromulina sp. CCMP291]
MRRCRVPAALPEAVFLVPGWGSAKVNKLVDLCPEWARSIDLVEATAETIAAVAARLGREKAGISVSALFKLREEFCKKHKAANGAATFDAQDAASAAQAESQAASRAADAARKRTAPARDADAARKRTARKSMDESARAADAARKRTAPARDANAARMRTARQSMAQDRPDDREAEVLDEMYGCNGSAFTRNSRRLRPLYGLAGAGLEGARQETAEDIDRYGRIDETDAVRIVNDYRDSLAQIKLRTCACCGLRSPEDRYERRHLISDIVTKFPDHWLLIERADVDRLDGFVPTGRGADAPVGLHAPRTCELLGPSSGPQMPRQRVVATRRTFHNVYFHASSGRHLHLIREAVEAREGQEGQEGFYCCDVCECGMEPKRPKAFFSDETVASHLPSNFLAHNPTFYASNAPTLSVAYGCDYGRTRLSMQGGGFLNLADVSTLELLLLSEVRMHHVTIKVSAESGATTERRTLNSHTLLWPQNTMGASSEGETLQHALDAALKRLHIAFVGPRGDTTRFERAALRVPDARLDAAVIWNAISVRRFLHGVEGGLEMPSLQEIERLLDGAVERHVREKARGLHDAVSIAADARGAGSDVAGVRAGAMSDEDRAAAGLAAEDAAGEHNADESASRVPNSYVGVFQVPERNMADFVDAIVRITSMGDEEGEGTTDGDCGAPSHAGGASLEEEDGAPPAPGAHARPEALRRRRHGELLDDYDRAAEGIYGAWWAIFPLRQGLRRGKPLTERAMEHLALYYDCRVAHCMSLLFHLANVRMRHDVNISVAARVKSTPEAFAEFRRLVCDPDFVKLLQSAQANPKGEAALVLLRKVLPFISLCGAKQRWGTQERAAEVTKHIAATRFFGLGSVFNSVSPDDVHDPLSIRMSFPTTGADEFPAHAPESFYDALVAPDAARQHHGSAPGQDMREATLQRLADNNPVATSAIFHKRAKMLIKDLIGIDPSARGNVRVDGEDRKTGIHGICASWKDVTECNKRKSQHLHGKGWGGLCPELLSDVADDPELMARWCAAQDSQCIGELPIAYQAVSVMQRHSTRSTDDERPVAKRRDAAVTHRHAMQAPIHDLREFLHHANMSAVNRGVHEHKATCTCGKRGVTGCRMCFGRVHGQPYTCAVCLHVGSDEKASDEKANLEGSTGDLIGWRCSLCYAEGSSDPAVIANEDNKRDVAFTVHF